VEEGLTTKATKPFSNDSILERAEAGHNEISAASVPLSEAGAAATSSPVNVASAQELIYNHALKCGREGAIKQLLGQHDAAKACYRVAGLLSEALLMETLCDTDRVTLTNYVSGFFLRFTECERESSNSRVGEGEGGGGGSGMSGTVTPVNGNQGVGGQDRNSM
jgi:hypothetical protein